MFSCQKQQLGVSEKNTTISNAQINRNFTGKIGIDLAGFGGVQPSFSGIEPIF